MRNNKFLCRKCQCNKCSYNEVPPADQPCKMCLYTVDKNGKDSIGTEFSGSAVTVLSVAEEINLLKQRIEQLEYEHFEVNRLFL